MPKFQVSRSIIVNSPAKQVFDALADFRTWTLPACNVFRVEHTGAYKHLGNPWSIANHMVRHKNLKQSRVGTYEIYRTVPPTPEQELVTDIYLPLK